MTRQVATEEDNDFMNSVLGEFDNEMPVSISSLNKRIKEEPVRKTRRLSPPIKGKKKTSSLSRSGHSGIKPGIPSSPPVFANDDDDEYGAPIGDDDIAMSDAPVPPSSPAADTKQRKKVIFKKEDSDSDDLAVAEIKGNRGVRTEAVNISASRPSLMAIPDHKPVVTTSRRSAGIDSSAWTDLAGSLNVMSSPQVEKTSYGKLSAKDVAEEDGSFKMYWLDYTEINGNLCLFGKVLDKRSNKYVSAFLKVDGIMRNLFFLPRGTRFSESPYSLNRDAER